MNESSTIKVRIAGTISDSIVDGPGFRYVVFFQGCKKRCLNCHNEKTWDLLGGSVVDVSSLFEGLNNPLLSGLTLSGGEPFLQAEAALVLAKEAHNRGLNVVTYSGYTLEQLRAFKDSIIDRLLDETDYLVDGEYVDSLRDLRLKYKGSSNQRFIDMKASVVKKTIVTLYEEIEE